MQILAFTSMLSSAAWLCNERLGSALHQICTLMCRTCTSAVLILPNVAKISEMCSVVTLRVSLPTLSLVVLRSAAAFCLPFEGSAAFTGSAGFAEEGLASGFSAAVSFAGAASLPEREEVCAEGLSLLGLAALAADPSVFRGGGGRDPLLLQRQQHRITPAVFENQPGYTPNRT